jgi:WD40 repeat protein
MLASLGTAAGWLGYQVTHSRSEADGFVQSATPDPAGEQSADAIRASPLGRLESSAIPPEDRFPWQPPELVAVLGEHRGRSWSSVDGIAYSPDGKQIASYGHGFDIRLWDAASLRERAVLKQHTRQLSCLAFSPNGKMLASGDHGKTLVLWDLTAAPPKVQAVRTFSEGVLGVAFSADGTTLATSGLRTIHLWQFRGENKPEQISLLNGPQQAWLGQLIFSRDGKTLVSVSSGALGDNVLFWNLQAKTFSPLLKANTGRIQSMAISPDGNNLAISRSHPKEKSWTVDLWNVAEPTRAEVTASLDRQTSYPSTVRFSPDGKILATATLRRDGDIRLWNLTGKAPTELAVIQKLSSVDAIDFSPDGKTLVSGHSSGMIRLWELEGTKLKERFSHKGHTDVVTRLAVSATGVLASGARDGTVRRWDLSGVEGKQIDLLNSEGDIALSRDGKTLALGNDDGTIELWDVGKEKSAQRLRFQAHKKRDQFSSISSLEFSADGKTLASHGYDGKIRLWNLTGKVPTERGTIDARASWSWALSFSQDGTRLALSELIAASVVRPEDRPTMRVWDITGTQPREIAAVLEQAPDMAALALAPDGRTLATGGGERDLGRPSPSPISLWRLSGKEPPRRTLRLDGHLLAINFMAYSPDGQMLVSAGQTGQVILWETMTGSKYREWQLPGQVARITFADDGRHLITANENGTLYVLRLGHGMATVADATTLWEPLASPDAARAYQAMWGMVASPRQTITLFQHRLQPAEGLTDEQVGQFIDRLDDRNFAERNKASAALEKLQEQAEPALRRRLAERPSLEVRQRIERLLEEPRPVRPERLRTMRAIQVLAQIGNRDCQRVLNRLAQGAPGAYETQLAQQALRRLMEPAQ